MSFTIVNLPSTVSFVSIDTRTAPNKVIMLPAASTVTGRLFTIKDQYGGAALSTYMLSTVGMDKIDGRNWIYTFSNAFGAISFLSDGRVGWRVVGLYDGSSTALPAVAASSFVPTSITGLQMWMDAADSSAASMTLSGSTVTVWKDKSGLGNDTTSRSGTPTLTSSAINGKSAISMAGGYFTGPLATANTGTQLHAFAVLTIDSSSGIWPRPLALGRPGVNDYDSSTTTFAIIRYSGSQAVGIGRAGQYLSVSIPAYSSAFLVQSSHNGSTEYMSVNGNLTVSSASTGQSGNFNITSYGLGVNTNTGDYFVWNGYYGEVMYFNVQLSDANRQKIEGYLAWKWGLQALLPGGHPYASAAP